MLSVKYWNIELHFTIIKKENQVTLIQVFNKTPLKLRKRRHAVLRQLKRELMTLYHVVL